jgi:hypothetical protein
MKQTTVAATTHLDSHFSRFTKEALEQAAAQINRGGRPAVTVEHDPTLPPLGKQTRAWVEQCEDGEYQLVVEHEIFDGMSWAEFPNGVRLFKQESATDRNPFVDRYAGAADDAFLYFDLVNFESKEALRSFVEDIKGESGEELAVKPFARKSALPDPEFLIGIAKVVAAYLVTKGALNKVGDKLNSLAAEDVAKFYSFVRAAVISAAKYSRPKGRPITYVFVARGTPTLEFVARSTDPDLVISAVKLERLEGALSDADFFHRTLGAVKIQYLLDAAGGWKFNYLLTDSGAVIGTEESVSRRARVLELLTQHHAALNESDPEQDTTTSGRELSGD